MALMVLLASAALVDAQHGHEGGHGGYGNGDYGNGGYGNGGYGNGGYGNG